MEQMIKRKNKTLEEAGNALQEIWQIHLMLDSIEIRGASNYRMLLNLVSSRIGTLACGFDDILTEATFALPEAEEEATNESV